MVRFRRRHCGREVAHRQFDPAERAGKDITGGTAQSLLDRSTLNETAPLSPGPESPHIRPHGEESRPRKKTRQKPEIESAQLEGVKTRRSADRAVAGGFAQP